MKFLTVSLCILMLCGCRLKATLDKKPPKEEQSKHDAAPPAPEPPPKVLPGPNDGKGIIGKMTNEIVDYEKAMKENPNLVESDPKMKGGDLLTMYASAYIDVGAKVGLMNMKHNLDIYRAEHDRSPTYDEFMKMIRENHVTFRMLRAHETYAYHAKEGRMTVLSDPEKDKTK